MAEQEEQAQLLEQATQAVANRYRRDMSDFDMHTYVPNDVATGYWTEVKDNNPQYATTIEQLRYALLTGNTALYTKRYSEFIRQLFYEFVPTVDPWAQRFLATILAARIEQGFHNITDSRIAPQDEVSSMADEMGLIGKDAVERWQHVTLQSGISSILEGKLQLPTIQ